MGPGRPRGRGGHETPPRRWAGGPKANKSLELIRVLAGPEKPFRRARGQIAAGRTRAAFLTPPRCLLSKQAPPVPFWELHSLAQSPALCHGAEPCRGKGRRGAAGEQLPMGTRGVAAFLGCSHPPPPPGAAAARTGTAFTKLLLYPHLGAWGVYPNPRLKGFSEVQPPKTNPVGDLPVPCPTCTLCSVGAGSSVGLFLHTLEEKRVPREQWDVFKGSREGERGLSAGRAPELTSNNLKLRMHRRGCPLGT